MKLSQKLPKMAFNLAIIILASAFLFIALLYFIQDSMVYFPHLYGKEYEQVLSITGVEEVGFKTSQGEQTCFYLPPASTGSARTNDLPERLWVAFGGNGGLALGWVELLLAYPRRDREAFLLIEYPAYGRCQGKPSPASILENTQAALKTLQVNKRWAKKDVDGRIFLLGHSIGAAAALQFSLVQPVQKLVLVAPFTSLHDMAKTSVGWPLCLLLKHRMNNRAAMLELAKKSSPPPITIIHGTKDQVVPFAMGKELAGMCPEFTQFIEMKGLDHNMILFDAQDTLFHAMR